MFYYLSYFHLQGVAGSLYFSDGSSFFAVVSGDGRGELKQLAPHEKGSATPSNPLQSISEGSADDGGLNVMLPRANLVYVVFQHHIYMAVDEDIVILTLNHSNPVYERIPIGHEPLQVWVFELRGDLFMYVLYEENQRGRLVTFRKYGKQVWKRYGADDFLLYSPRWYNLENITKPLLFKAPSVFDSSLDSIYAAVAIGWNIDVNVLTSGNYLSIEVPSPCDNTTRLVYNEHRHDILVECLEATMYLHYESGEFIREGIWEGKIGNSSFSPHDGRFAAIVSNAGDVSIVSVIQLFDTKPHYRYFQLASSMGRIAASQFVSISHTQHYLCYAEYGVPGVKCIDVEKAIQNPDIPGVALGRLEHTEVAWNRDTDTFAMYAHHSVLALTAGNCSTDPCQSLIMAFDMTSLSNIWNVTGIKPQFLAWRPNPIPDQIEATQPSVTTTSEPTEPETVPTSESSPKPNSVPTEELETDSPPMSDKPPNPDTIPVSMETTPEDPTGTGTDTNPVPDSNPQAGGTPEQPNPDSCHAQLTRATSDYQRLLWITISICTCFCVAMVIVIALMLLMILLTRASFLRHRSSGEENSQTDQKVEIVKKT